MPLNIAHLKFRSYHFVFKTLYSMTGPGVGAPVMFLNKGGFVVTKNIKEPTHVLTTKFDILGKPECPVSQTRTSGFYSYEMVNISKCRLTLYIRQVGPYRHVFQVIHVFLGQFG
jgi:hypothetical protein